MEALIQTMCPGVTASIIAALILIWIQFQYSTAGYRVKKVREATEKITRLNADTSLLRNKYRYSLGVIIDDLHQSFKNGFNERGAWPVLVDNGDECEQQMDKSGDRWDKFNRNVRPVVGSETKVRIWFANQEYIKSCKKNTSVLDEVQF